MPPRATTRVGRPRLSRWLPRVLRDASLFGAAHAQWASESSYGSGHPSLLNPSPHMQSFWGCPCLCSSLAFAQFSNSFLCCYAELPSRLHHINACGKTAMESRIRNAESRNSGWNRSRLGLKPTWAQADAALERGLVKPSLACPVTRKPLHPCRLTFLGVSRRSRRPPCSPGATITTPLLLPTAGCKSNLKASPRLPGSPPSLMIKKILYQN